MPNLRIVYKRKYKYPFWIEERELLFFWSTLACFSTLEEAEDYIKAIKANPPPPKNLPIYYP